MASHGTKPMAFGLIVIGDEILSGRRADRHFAHVRKTLQARGLALAWVQYLGDERPRLVQCLRQSRATGDTVFSCGGIGATPDDHTRKAAAEAFGLPLVLHPEAERRIRAHCEQRGLPVTETRLDLGRFPAGADLIPNPVNGIPGFALHGHWFLPGFPEMAWPMLEWVLETHYRDRFQPGAMAERSLTVRGLPESTLVPLLQAIERDWPQVRVFSLPRLNPDDPAAYETELGVKGPAADLDAAFGQLRQGVLALGGQLIEAA